MAAKPKQQHDLWLLIGLDPYQIEQQVHHLIREHLGDDHSLNIGRLDGRRLNLNEFLSRIMNFSLFDPKTVIWVEGIEFLVELDKVQLDELLQKLTSAIPEGTRIILTSAKVDKRKKNISALLKEFHVTEFVDKKAHLEATHFLEEKLENARFELSREMKENLLDMIGDDFAKIDKEIDKIINFYNHDPRQVKLEEIHHLMSQDQVQPLYRLTEFVGEKKIDAALSLLDQLIRQGENSKGILSSFINRIRLLMEAKELSEHFESVVNYYDERKIRHSIEQMPDSIKEQMPDERQYSLTKQHPYRIFLFLRQSRSFKKEELQRFYKLCANTFQKLAGKKSDKLVLETLLLEWN